MPRCPTPAPITLAQLEHLEHLVLQPETPTSGHYRLASDEELASGGTIPSFYSLTAYLEGLAKVCLAVEKL